MSETVTISKDTFLRISNALIKVEKYLDGKEQESAKWVDEATALELLGCSKSTLYRIKGKEIKYKAIGKKHQYDRKSIEKYIHLMSS